MTNQSEILNVFGALTMSSVEIAKMCEKEHKNVLRDIDKIVEEFNKLSEKSASSNLRWLVKSSTYLDSQGKSRKCYELSKQATIDLISGYSFEVRYRINRRWEELETLQKSKIPRTFEEALRLAADLERDKNLILNEKIKVENELEEANEALEVADDFIDSHIFFPKYIPAEDYVEDDYVTRNELFDEWFPELGKSFVALNCVLAYYNCERAIYVGSNGIKKEVYLKANLDSIREKFENDLQIVSRSKSRKTVLALHPALPNTRMTIKIHNIARYLNNNSI